MKKKTSILSYDNLKNARDSGGETGQWFNKHEKLCIAIFAIMLVGLLAISPFIPDNGHKTIKSELTKAGYNVDDIEFMLIENDGFTGKRIYQSSEPIEYAAGIYVEQWELSNYSFGTFISHYSVNPYPELPSAIPVNLCVTVTQEDYELLVEQANGQDVEEYIKHLIYNSIKELNNHAS